MELLAQLEDNIWKQTKPLSTRKTVRVIAKRSDGKLAFLRIKGEDEFGKRNHLETIGGGIEENENFIEAIQREVMEEVGYTCRVVDEIGMIIDTYHLINRKTISHFFVVELGKDCKITAHTQLEESLIACVEWLTPMQASEMLSQEIEGIGKLIQRRDLIALTKYLKQIGISN